MLRTDLTDDTAAAGLHPAQHNEANQAVLDLQAAGFPIVRKFPFAFDTPGLLAGAEVYTPTVGDVLLDAWIEIVEAWDGATPKGDFGTFDGVVFGLIASSSGPADMTNPDIETAGAGYRFGGYTNVNGLAMNDYVYLSPNSVFQRMAPGIFTAASPIKVCVSTTGYTTGSDPGSGAGAAVLYLVTATPV